MIHQYNSNVIVSSLMIIIWMNDNSVWFISGSIWGVVCLSFWMKKRVFFLNFFLVNLFVTWVPCDKQFFFFFKSITISLFEFMNEWMNQSFIIPFDDIKKNIWKRWYFWFEMECFHQPFLKSIRPRRIDKLLSGITALFSQNTCAAQSKTVLETMLREKHKLD